MLDDVLSGLRAGVFGMPGEYQALQSGYSKARAEGYQGSELEFFADMLDLYETAPENDPRHKTWFSGQTMHAARGLGRAS